MSSRVIRFDDYPVMPWKNGLGVTRAIVAVPPTLAGRIRYSPPMPGFRDQLTQRMPQGTVIKTMAIYERPFWREQGLNGQVTSLSGPIGAMFDASPASGTPVPNWS